MGGSPEARFARARGIGRARFFRGRGDPKGRSVVQLREGSEASLDPVVAVGSRVRRQVHVEHEVRRVTSCREHSSSVGGLVDGAAVDLEEREGNR